MSIDNIEILNNTEIFLEKLKTDLRNIKLKNHQTIQFHSSEFRTEKKLNQNIIKIILNFHPLIYTIELVQINKLNKLLRLFENFSKENKIKIKNRDRVNVSKYNKSNSPFLYVGCSTTDFVSRLKNHFGTKGNRVYGLHLCKWDENLDYDILLRTYQVENSKDFKTQKALIELIEQQVWDVLKPNFGKRSGQ